MLMQIIIIALCCHCLPPCPPTPQSAGQQLPQQPPQQQQQHTGSSDSHTAAAAAAAGQLSSLAITNSFGMPSMDRDYLLRDIPRAAAALGEGQVGGRADDANMSCHALRLHARKGQGRAEVRQGGAPKPLLTFRLTAVGGGMLL